MLKKLTLLAVFCVLLFAFCKKTTYVDVPPQLKVIVSDVAGAKASGCGLSLYANAEDWKNQTNKIGETLQTDAKGEATFNNLDAKIYFVYASKGTQNNLFGINTFKAPLEMNTLFSLQISLQ